MPTRYSHYCPTARALEKIGERWSLLIIRDLLEGPQRFTDLMSSLKNITPRLLSSRLSELELIGVIERHSVQGRREVWYRLTKAGMALDPVIDALHSWGLRFAMRPPLPGEVVNEKLLMRQWVKSLNKQAEQSADTLTCSIKFPVISYLLVYKDRVWESRPGEDAKADVRITVTPEMFVTIFFVPRAERKKIFNKFHVEGKPEKIRQIQKIMGISGVKKR